MKGGNIERLIEKHAGSLDEIHGNPEKYFGEITEEEMNYYKLRIKRYE